MLAVFVVLLMLSWVIGDSLRTLLGGSGNPGAGRIRMALVAETEECVEAARRIVTFVKGA